MNGGYGIPFRYITPDVYGEKFGSGRIPGGTRGYTWSNWQGWLSPETEEQHLAGMAMAGGAILLLLGVWWLLVGRTQKEMVWEPNIPSDEDE